METEPNLFTKIWIVAIMVSMIVGVVPQDKKPTNWKWLIPDKQVRGICLFFIAFYIFVAFPILFKFTATILFIGLLALGFWKLKGALYIKSTLTKE